jgi:hypothetical protein
MTSPHPLFRAEYGRLIRRELLLRFDVLAWLNFAEAEGVELTALAEIKDADKVFNGLCFGAYLSECMRSYRKPKLSHKQVAKIVENLPRKKQTEIIAHIQQAKVFGRTPQEWADEQGSKKKK